MVKRLSCVIIFLALFVLLSTAPMANVNAAVTCTWTGAAGVAGSGVWSASGNWDCGHAPQNNDDVVISMVGVTVTQDGSTASLASLTFSNATLTTTSPTSNFSINFNNSGVLTLSSGTIGGSGDIKSVATLNWTGGTISRTGNFSISGNGTAANLSGTLTLNSTVFTASNSIAISGDSAGSLSGSGTVTNSGALTKSGTGAFTISGVTFSNTGSVSVTTGALAVALKIGTSSSGTYIVASGATLSLSGTHTLTTNAKISGTTSGAGTVQFTSGSFTISSGYDLTGGSSGPAGATSISGGASVDLHSLTLAAGNLGNQLSLGSGSLNLGTNNLTLTGLNWNGDTSGSTLSGSGTATVNTSIALSGSLTLTGYTLTTGSTTTTVTASGTGSLSGTGTLNMSGAMTKDTGSTTFAISGITFNHTGTVTVAAGALGVELKSGTSSSGTYTVASGAILSLSGTHTFSSGATIAGTTTGAGTVAFTSGSFTVSSGYNLTGGVSGPAGATSISGGASVDLHTLTLAAGNLGNQLSLGSGSLNLGSNNLTLTSLSWNGSTSGSTLLGSGTATVSTDITLSGTLTLTGYTLTTSSGTTTVTVNGTGSLSGTGTLNMAGLLTKNTASTTFTISGITFNSTGTVTVAAGTLGIALPSGGSTSSTIYQVDSGAFLELGGSTFDFNSGSTISGAGTVTFSSGTINIYSDYELAGDTFISGTSTAVYIDFPVPMPTTPSTGSFTITNASLAFNGSHHFGTTAGFSGSGTVTFNSGTFTIDGDYELSGETILAEVGSIVNITYPTPAQSSIGMFTVTAGSLTFSGSHTFDTNADFTGSGSVKFTSGTVVINGDYELSGATTLNGSGLGVTINYPSGTVNTSTGDFILTSGSLTLNGSHTYGSGAGFSGAGTLDFVSGTITFNSGSGYSLGSTGATTVSGATVDMSSLTSVGLGDTLTLSDGSLDLGALDVTLTDMTWSGGSLTGTGTATISGTLTLSGSPVMAGYNLSTEAGSTTPISIGTGGSASLTGTGALDLAGTLTKSGAGGFAISGITFNNTGAVSVTGGTLAVELPTGVTKNGTYSVSSGAILELSASTSTTNIATIGGSITGSGSVEFLAGHLAVTGGYNLTTGGASVVSGAIVDMHSLTSIALGDTLTLSAGSLDLGSNDVILSSLSWSGGTVLDSSTGTTTGIATVNTSIDLSGALTLTKYFLATGNNPTTTPVTVSGVGSLSGTGTFDMSGALTKSGAGTFSISGISFNNTGSVSVEGGTLSIALLSGDTGSGTYSVPTGNTLAFSGTYTFPAGATISGAGTVEFSSGTFALSGVDYIPAGPTHLVGASALVTIAYPASPAGTSAGTFSVNSGSTLTFSGNETFTGVISGAGNVTFTSGTFTVGSNYTISGTTHLLGPPCSLPSTTHQHCQEVAVPAPSISIRDRR